MFTQGEINDFYHKTAGRIICAIKYNKVLEMCLGNKKDLSGFIEEINLSDEALICLTKQQKTLFEKWIGLALEEYNKFPDNYSKNELKEAARISNGMDWFNYKKLQGFLNWFRAGVYY